MWIHDTEWYVVTLSFESTPNLNGFFSPYDRAGGLSANLLKKKKEKKRDKQKDTGLKPKPPGWTRELNAVELVPATCDECGPR